MVFEVLFAFGVAGVIAWGVLYVLRRCWRCGDG